MGTNKIMNKDDITEAVHGLDIFTKNWCLNCAETDKKEGIVFNCDKCDFKARDGSCLIKVFAHDHKHDYPMQDFGSMGGLYFKNLES